MIQESDEPNRSHFSRGSSQSFYECPLCTENVPEDDRDKHVSFQCKSLMNSGGIDGLYCMRNDASNVYQCPLCLKNILQKDKASHETFECKILIENSGVQLYESYAEVPKKTCGCSESASYAQVTKKRCGCNCKGSQTSEICSVCKNRIPQKKRAEHNRSCQPSKFPCPHCDQTIDVACEEIHLQSCPALEENRSCKDLKTRVYHTRSSSFEHGGAIPKNANIKDMIRPQTAKCMYCQTTLNADIVKYHEEECFQQPITCPDCFAPILMEELGIHSCKKKKGKDLPVQNRAAIEEEAENSCKLTSEHTDGTNRSPKANINQHISDFKFGSHENSALSTKDMTLSKESIDEKSEKIYKATSRFIGNTSKNQIEHVSNFNLKDLKFGTHESKALSSESNVYCTVLPEKKDEEREKLPEQKLSRCINSAKDKKESTKNLRQQQLSDFRFGAHKTRSLSSENNVHHSALLEKNNEEREKVCEQNIPCKFVTHETRSSEENEKKNRHHEKCTFNLESGELGLPDIQDYDTDFVELKWDLPLRDDGASITGYIIEKKDNCNSEWVHVKEVKSNIPKAKVTGLNEGDEYEFRVRAVNEVGPGEPSLPSSPHLSKPKNCVASYNSLKDLFLSGEDCDVTIEVKGKKFGVHRSVLKTLTPVLSTIFPHDVRKNSDISETVNISEVDCNPSAFKEFLLFIYSGNVLSDENVTSVYYISSKFDLPKLKKKCVQYMRTALSSNSICDFIYLAARYNEHQLLEEAMKFFMKNVEEILVTSKWMHFLQENSILANDLLVETFKNCLH